MSPMSQNNLSSFFFDLFNKNIRNSEIAMIIAGPGISVTVNEKNGIFSIIGRGDYIGVRINPNLFSIGLDPKSDEFSTLIKRVGTIGKRVIGRRVNEAREERDAALPIAA